MKTNGQEGHRMAKAWLALALAASIAAPAPGLALGFIPHILPQKHAKATADASKAQDLVAQASQALAERRYVDAGSLLDQARDMGLKWPVLSTLRGELLLARGRFADALEAFRAVAADPTQKARALEGEGLALSMLGRSDEALADLKAATALDKSLWHAWNGLGREYDLRRDWPKAKAAYATALATPGGNTAIVLNNRGYSFLLQKQTTAAAADFVAALQKDPSLAAARTNLRITLAMEGNYARASATGVGDDRAAVLNNVGLAAAMRGDFLQADKLLSEAMAAKGQFYGLAADNLQLARALAARQDQATIAPNDPR